MQHSHEALDRPGGISRKHIFAPLQHRDFGVLWVGMAVSLLGDGIFFVAIAWETYSLWNAPAALSIVSIGMTLPLIAFLLVGGVVSDRYNRRIVMACADAVRAVGGYRPLFWEEYDLFLRLRALGPFLHLPRPLYRYRRHEGSMTADPERRRAGWRELLAAWDLASLRAAGRDEELEMIASTLSGVHA